MLLETVQGYEVLGFNIGPRQSTITFVQPLRSVQISGTSQAIRSGVLARSRLILTNAFPHEIARSSDSRFSGIIGQYWWKITHTQTRIRHWEIAEGVSPSISFERSIALVEKYCPARDLCVCVSCFNKQAVTGQLLICETQGDRALWCYSVQRSYAPEREASTGPWMCTCEHVLTMFFYVNESCDPSFTMLLVSIIRYEIFCHLWQLGAKPQTQHAESRALRMQ